MVGEKDSNRPFFSIVVPPRVGAEASGPAPPGRRLLGRLLVVVLILVASAAAIGAGAPQARACSVSASQGDRYRGAGNDNGTRAFIQGSSTLSSCGGAVATVSIQSCTTNCTPGMIQTGYVKQTGTFDSPDCGFVSNGPIFTE